MVVLVAAVVVFVLLLSVLARSAGVTRFRYRAGKPVLSPVELAFYQRLRRLVEPRALVLAKVRIADVLSVDGKSAGRRSIVALNVIAAKHTDFCIIDPASAIPIACIELDDASHGSAAARKRDALVNDAFATAGLRLLRVPLKEIRSDEDLQSRIFGAIREVQLHNAEQPDEIRVVAPEEFVSANCSRCGRPMVQRQGERGMFWGCSSYPKCRHTLPMV